MSDIAIKVEGISKKYVIGENKNHPTLRDKLMELPSRLFKGPKKTKEFWALKDVSFEVKKGEVVGIIGRNGAGKSTLLKILARITEPTSGQITMYGRVASMLEVGTGFNPELTGRENIYLNGSIIGMKKAEIEQRFNDIVAFSGVEKFLDTPVKHYSSGMYVRLAFAVAAHLDVDILLVDEVLAVGDAEFQKKCLGKMSDLANSGRTVIFVSHNLAAVRSLCSRIILIQNSKVSYTGNNLEDVISKYSGDNAKDVNGILKKINAYKNDYFHVTGLELYNIKKSNSHVYERNEEVFLKISGKLQKLDNELTIGYAIFDSNDSLLYWSYPSDIPSPVNHPLKSGKLTLSTRIPVELLNLGSYRIELIGGLHNKKWIFSPRGNVPYIYLKIVGKISESIYWQQQRPTIISPILEWSVKNE